MNKQLDTIKAIGEEVGMPNLLDKILSIGKKRTEQLDEVGIASKQAVMKTEDGYEYPSRCYAYVPDSEEVSTWKLRLCAPETTEITREQLGAAAAAFSTGGFRGNRVELPDADVGNVKRRIRAEYEKLGVEREDMPESIKSYGGIMDGLKEKFAEAIKSYSGNMRKKMDGVLSEMEKAEADQMATVRQLSELVAQVEEEDLRVALEELIKSMQETLMSEDEEVEEEEMVMDEESEKQSCEDEKSFDVNEIAEALKLNDLSDLLEEHNKALGNQSKAVTGLVEAVETLVEKNKQLFERVEKLEEKSQEVESKTKELEKDDETKIAEKQARFSPFWASKYHASKAAETVLSEDEEKQFAKPEVPQAISSITRSIFRGK